MTVSLPRISVLILMLSGVSLQASAHLGASSSDLKMLNYQLVTVKLQNPNQVFLTPQKYLMARQEDAENRSKEMTPEQRKRLQERRKRFESLPPEERQRLKDARQKFRQLPPEERKRLRQKWRNLTPEEREKAIEKKRKKKA